MKVLLNKITNNYAEIYSDHYGRIETVVEENNTPTLFEDYMDLSTLSNSAYRTAKIDLNNYELIEVELIRK